MRESVLKFAEHMEKILKENDHKGGWSGCSPYFLFLRLEEETEKELKEAFLISDREKILKECADVANFAMMIFDVVEASK